MTRSKKCPRGCVPVGQVQLKDFVPPSSSLHVNDPEMNYLYHATNEERAYEIARKGLLTHSPGYGTDQSTWPDGSVQCRSYWSAFSHGVWSFAPEEGKPVILRTPRGQGRFQQERYTGDWYTTSPIPPTRIEILTTEGWRPLSVLREERTSR